jgi:O-antigen/teichoic acid export membrane protein
MSTIRRQSIISSGIVYFGFALGFLNAYLFVREGSGFTKEQYGLTGVFIALANIMFAVSSLGMQSFIYKFYPYYHDNLRPKENDMMAWALTTSTIGFGLVITGGWIFRDLVIKKYVTNAPDLVKYYYLVFPFGFGLTLFSLLEAYAWQLKKSVLTNYLREVQFRLFTTLLIILFSVGIIYDFDLFIKLYAATYLLLAFILIGYLFATKQITLTFRVSRVTRKFSKKIVRQASFIWGGIILFTLSNVFDSLVIAAVMPDGLAFAGIYTLAQNVASIIQAPQRGIIASSLAVLSRAWKDKDMDKIRKVYHRSSVNQIIFSAGLFVLIWINFVDGVFTFHLQKEYLLARDIFLYIGLMRIIDMGTGVNAQIIGTSTFWRFDFISGIVLVVITLPLNYLLTKSEGVTGPAIANLFSLTVYNVIRYVFLLRKFNMQPFTIRSLYPLILAVAGYLVCTFLFADKQGLLWIIVRSSVFLAIYAGGVITLNVSPDIIPVWQTLKKKIGFKNSRKD